MKFHIVCEGESLRKIAFLYGLSEEELQKENKHIRVWERLIPGTKLKIPNIPEAVDLDINSMEPFVEDYYPKLKLDVGAMSNPNPEVQIKNEPEYQSVEIISPEAPTEVETEIKQTANSNEIKTLNEVIENTENKTNAKPNIEDIPELKHYKNLEAQVIMPVPITPYQYLSYYSYPRYVYPQYVYPVYVYPPYQNK